MERQADPLEGSEETIDDVKVKKGMSHARRAFLIIALLIWLEIVVAAYFLVHKPWPIGQNLAPFLAFTDVILSLALIALAGGLGRRILGTLSSCAPLERMALHAAGGLGVLSFGVLAFGLAGWLRPWLAWVVLGLGLLLFRSEIIAWARDWRSMGEGYGDLGWLARGASGLVCFLLVSGLLQALAPPLKWDSLVYHLELPKRYLAAGKVIFLDDNLFVGQPQLAEMIYMWAMALRSSTTAATLGWAIGAIGLFGVGGFAGRILGSHAKWLAPAILISGASISRGLSWAYVDLWVMLFALAATVAIDYYMETRDRRWLTWAGFAAGFALCTKYTAGIMIVLGVIALSADWIKAVLSSRFLRSRITERHNDNMDQHLLREKIRVKGTSNLIKDILLYCGVALLVASPWLLKNLAFTGNPIYPFLFPGREVDSLRQTFHAGTMPQRTIMDHLTLPLQVTIIGIEGGPVFNTSVSPLMLAFLPGVLLGWQSFDKKRQEKFGRLLAMVITTWPLWIIGSLITFVLIRSRHYYAVFPAVAVLATAGLDVASRLRLTRIRVGWVIVGLVQLVFGFTALSEMFYFVKVDPLGVIAGAQREEEYVADQLGWFGPAMERVNSLPSGSKIALLWEPRAFYCQVTCSPDVILDRWWYMHRTAGNAENIANRFAAEGFTHLLIYDFGIRLEKEARELFEPSDWVELDRLREEELILLMEFGEAYSLYELQ